RVLAWAKPGSGLAAAPSMPPVAGGKRGPRSGAGRGPSPKKKTRPPGHRSSAASLQHVGGRRRVGGSPQRPALLHSVFIAGLATDFGLTLEQAPCRTERGAVRVSKPTLPPGSATLVATT